MNGEKALIGHEPRVQAVLDLNNPKGSTAHVGFQTTKPVFKTGVNKCHVNFVVSDGGWEDQFAVAAESNPHILSYVKNQGLGLEVPYKFGSNARSYFPDFIVQIDDGNFVDDPLNLIVDVKGFRNENAKLKSETMNTRWIPGVNNLGRWGRWGFAEIEDARTASDELNVLVNNCLLQSNCAMTKQYSIRDTT